MGEDTRHVQTRSRCGNSEVPGISWSDTGATTSSVNLYQHLERARRALDDVCQCGRSLDRVHTDREIGLVVQLLQSSALGATGPKGKGNEDVAEAGSCQHLRFAQ